MKLQGINKKKYMIFYFFYFVFFIFIKSGIAFANSVIPKYFDLEEKIQINPDGSGIYMGKIITDPIFANELKKEKLLQIPGKKVLVENILKDEKFYHIESVYFKNLRELTLENDIIKIKVIKKSLTEPGKQKAVFEHSMYNPKNYKASGEEKIILSRHRYIYIVELPGRIQKADSIIDGIKIEPEVRENKVIWRIPLDLAIEATRMNFLIEFEGEFNFTSNILSTQKFLDQELIQEARKKTEREKVKIEVETFPELFPVIAKFLAEGNRCFKIPHLVRWRIWNNSNQTIKITVTAEIPEWAPPVIKTVTLAPNEFKEVSQTPFGIALLRNYSIIPATLILRAKKEGKIIYEETRNIKIRAADEVIWSLYIPYDTEYMIAAWVTPKDPAVEKILSIAKEKLYTRSLSGYMGDVESQVRAIFNAVRDIGISYVSSTLAFGQIGFTQRVRLPRESIAQRAMNCIDGAVLFASLFENIGLEPLIILAPSHAFVGVRLFPGSQETLFIETTLVGRPEATFDTAVRVGTEEYMKLLYQSRYNPNILRIIDIKKAREMGIYPLW